MYKSGVNNFNFDITNTIITIGIIIIMLYVGVANCALIVSRYIIIKGVSIECHTRSKIGSLTGAPPFQVSR